MDLTQSIAIIYLVVMAAFSVGFLINWYRNRTVMAAYKRIGFWAGVIFVVFELASLVMGAGSLFASVCVLIPALGWDILHLWGFVNNGIFFSNQLSIHSFPLIAPRLGLPAPVATPVVDLNTTPAPDGSTVLANTRIITEGAFFSSIDTSAASAVPLKPEPIALASDVPSSVAPAAAVLTRPPIHWPRYWLNIGVMVMAAIAYSAVLFFVAQPRIGLAARNLVSSDRQVLTPLSLIIVLEFAFAEELMFRLGIQNYFGAKLINKRYGYAIAIVLTAALWTLAHVGTLDPDWVKLVQIFPLGLALG